MRRCIVALYALAMMLIPIFGVALPVSAHSINPTVSHQRSHPLRPSTVTAGCDSLNTARIYEGSPKNVCIGFNGSGYLAGSWSPIQLVYAWSGYPIWIRYYDYSVAEYCSLPGNSGVQGQGTSGTITQINIGNTGGYPTCQNPLPHG